MANKLRTLVQLPVVVGKEEMVMNNDTPVCGKGALFFVPGTKTRLCREHARLFMKAHEGTLLMYDSTLLPDGIRCNWDMSDSEARRKR